MWVEAGRSGSKCMRTNIIRGCNQAFVTSLYHDVQEMFKVRRSGTTENVGYLCCEAFRDNRKCRSLFFETIKSKQQQVCGNESRVLISAASAL